MLPTPLPEPSSPDGMDKHSLLALGNKTLHLLYYFVLTPSLPLQCKAVVKAVLKRQCKRKKSSVSLQFSHPSINIEHDFLCVVCLVGVLETETERDSECVAIRARENQKGGKKREREEEVKKKWKEKRSRKEKEGKERSGRGREPIESTPSSHT